MMASGIVRDFDEKFCQCPICLEQFKEPKLLPCLHRFCRSCLDAMIHNGDRETISCPNCRQECTVPEEGLDGFKTDFYTKNIIEYIQLQTTLSDTGVQKCYSCSKTLNISAYCWMCNDFLCKACHSYHMTSQVTKSHRILTVNGEHVKPEHHKSVKFASFLAPLEEDTGCFSHSVSESETLSDICCKNNIDVCMLSACNIHKDSNVREVGVQALELREKVKHEIAELLPFKDKILRLPQKLEGIKDIIDNLTLKTKRFVKSEHGNECSKIYLNIQPLTDEKKIPKAKGVGKLTFVLSPLRQVIKKEIHMIREKYNRLCDKKIEKLRNGLEIPQQHQHEQTKKLDNGHVASKSGCEQATEPLERQPESNINKAQEILEQIEITINIFENLESMASSVLTSMDDWTVIRFTPAILATKVTLIEKMRKEIPDLDTLINIIKSLMSISSDDFCSIKTIHKDRVVQIEDMALREWQISNITASSNGRIIVTGNATKGQYHISVINIKGTILFQEQRSCNDCIYPNRLCDILSESEIVTVFNPGELSIYNIAHYYCVKRNVSKNSCEWPPEPGATCIASDIDNNTIFVGNLRCRYLYLFDGELNFCRSLVLPNDRMTGCHGVAVYESNVVICDYNGSIAIAMKTNGEMVYEFEKPLGFKSEWKPITVCTDKIRLIFILWCNGSSYYTGKHVVTLNSPENGEMLAVKTVDNDAYCMTTMKSKESTKLLVATLRKGQIFVYDLPIGKKHQIISTESDQPSDTGLTVPWSRQARIDAPVSEASCALPINLYGHFFCQAKGLSAKALRVVPLVKKTANEILVHVWVCCDNEPLFCGLLQSEKSFNFKPLATWESFIIYEKHNNILVDAERIGQQVIDLSRIWNGQKAKARFLIEGGRLADVMNLKMTIRQVSNHECLVFYTDFEVSHHVSSRHTSDAFPSESLSLPQMKSHDDRMNATIKFLSRELGHEWITVGRELGVPNSDLSHIKAENNYTQAAIYEMLLRWKQQQGSRANYSVLNKALNIVGRTDLAEKLINEQDLLE